MPNEPQLEFLYEISASLDPPIAIGENPHGNRQISPVTGGSFEGPHLKGKVLAGGGEWLLVRPDGVGELDTRATFQTDDGAFIYVTFRGYITKILELSPRCAVRLASAGRGHWQGIAHSRWRQLSSLRGSVS